MEKIPRLNMDQRSNLVAYLDGELPEPAAKEIEHVLSKSPTVQHDVDMLSRTWDLLDQLPRLAGSSDLTGAWSRSSRPTKRPSPSCRPFGSAGFRKNRCAKAAIVAVWAAGLDAAVLGFLVTNRLIPDPSNRVAPEPPRDREARSVHERRID